MAVCEPVTAAGGSLRRKAEATARQADPLRYNEAQVVKTMIKKQHTEKRRQDTARDGRQHFLGERHIRPDTLGFIVSGGHYFLRARSEVRSERDCSTESRCEAYQQNPRDARRRACA